MSLRPAQELVAESSKFSLRTFFESTSSPSPPQSQSQSPPYSQFFLPSEATGTVYKPPKSTIPMNVEQALRQQPPLSYNSKPAHSVFSPTAIATATATATTTATTTISAPKEHKFTFNGLVSTATPMQKQHQFLQKHQQATTKSHVPKYSEQRHDPSEVALLKAHVLSLTEQANDLNANLESTSESVVIGNKALRTERAQFHAKFTHLTNKLQAAQAELAVGADMGYKTVADIEMLNGEIVNLQEHVKKLTHANKELNDTNTNLVTANQELASDIKSTSAALGIVDCLNAQTGAECLPINEPIDACATTQQQFVDQETKYTALAAQHSVALQRQEQLVHDLEEYKVLLSTASAEVDAVNAVLDANKVVMATTDQLVDDLDERLALARMAPQEPMDDQMPVEVPIAAAVCCPKILRSEELKKCAEAARSAMHLATDENCERLGEECRFADAMAKRAVWSLEQNLPERVIVAHLYTDNIDNADNTDAVDDECCYMNEHVQDNPLILGKPFDEPIYLARVGAQGMAISFASSAGKVISDRTNEYVQSVSKDLKFHMDDSQALYKSSSTTGIALKV